MKTKLNALEVASVVLQTIHDDDAMWIDFLDANTARVRYFVRQYVRLTHEASGLANQQSHIRRLLREHELWTQAIASTIKMGPTDDWDGSTKRWCDITRKYYQPWTLDACQDEMVAALKVVHAFQSSTDKQTSGVSFFGWREVRRVDHVLGAFQFEFYKTFRGCDIMDYVNLAWDAFTDATMYNKVFSGANALGHHDTLQQLGPNMMIVRTDQRLSAMNVDAHSVYLVFRRRTERGFIQCVRTIDCPELKREIDDPRAMWPSNFIWFELVLLDGNDQGYEFRGGGSMGEIDLDYATFWMVASFGCVLRSEQIATGHKLLVCD